MTTQQEIVPSLLDVDWIATLAYAWQGMMMHIRMTLTKNLPEDALRNFGVHTGGDNNDLRSQLILSHVLGFRSILTLGSSLADLQLVYRSNEPRYLLGDLVADTPYTLLLFVGIFPDHDADLQSAFVEFVKKLPDRCNRFIITNQYDIRKYDEDDDVLGDFDAEVHTQLSVPLRTLVIVTNEGTIIRKSLWSRKKEALEFLLGLSAKKPPLA